MRVLLVDNYDSFTFNIAQMVGEVCGAFPLVVKNDELDEEALHSLDVDCAIISPGPGRPDREADFGISRAVLEWSDLPVLGVCLGHQGIGCMAGAPVLSAPEPMHGRTSTVRHLGDPLFAGIPSTFQAVRYHSLILPSELPDNLEVIATTDGDLVMALRQLDAPRWGVQFHPESIGSEYGHRLFANFLNLAGAPPSSLRVPLKPHRPAVSKSAGSPVTPVHKGSAFVVHSRRIAGTFDTERAFFHLYRSSPEAFWLDSSSVIEGYSRFSFMGDACGPHAQLLIYDLAGNRVFRRFGDRSETISRSIFEHLKDDLDRLRIEDPGLPFDFCGGWVGYLGYELKALCGASHAHSAKEPDAAFIFADRFVAFDHLEGCAWLVHLALPGEEGMVRAWMDEMEARLRSLPAMKPLRPAKTGRKVVFQPRHGRDAYIDRIRRSQEEIRHGESYEICLTNEIWTATKPDPNLVYHHLRRINPAPYAAFLRMPGTTVMCSSPERFLKMDRAGRLEAKPIKGTAPRHEDKERDREAAFSLRASEKERAENLMIVDLLRNDFGEVCEIGSVHVPKLMQVESYATVHQLVSTIAGTLATDRSPLDAIVAAFPGGSMTGAPKVRTMEIIDELEGGPRGVYSGAIGFVGLNGTIDLNIVIRTIVAGPLGLSIGSGGAITYLSDAHAEHEEMMLKAHPPMRAIAYACTGDEDGWTLVEPLDLEAGCRASERGRAEECGSDRLVIKAGTIKNMGRASVAAPRSF